MAFIGKHQSTHMSCTVNPGLYNHPSLDHVQSTLASTPTSVQIIYGQRWLIQPPQSKSCTVNPGLYNHPGLNLVQLTLAYTTTSVSILEVNPGLYTHTKSCSVKPGLCNHPFCEGKEAQKEKCTHVQYSKTLHVLYN